MRQLIITQWLSLDGVFDAGSMDKWWVPFDSTSRQQYIRDSINHCEVMLYGRKTVRPWFQRRPARQLLRSQGVLQKERCAKATVRRGDQYDVPLIARFFKTCFQPFNAL